MRLFIALNFNNKEKAQINEIISIVRANSTQGRFVDLEQIHLTVEFLGEIDNSGVNVIKEIMDKLDFSAFSLKLIKAGTFKRSEGNIHWLGIERNDTLLKIYNLLHKELKDKGFLLEDREYRPHITLGRKVVLKANYNINQLDGIVRDIKIDINKVDLMKSEFINGNVKYSVIYSKRLN